MEVCFHRQALAALLLRMNNRVDIIQPCEACINSSGLHNTSSRECSVNTAMTEI
jgi:hypothetical protein